MPRRLLCAAVLLGGLALPTPALAWWEATLQQVDMTVHLGRDGRGRVTYELLFHVDRGRFEGLDIADPGRAIDWDRTACFIEDAEGRRVPARVSRRARDGAYVVRVVRPPGLPRGRVTVSLTYVEDLNARCLSTDPQGRAHFEWSGLPWEVGMDRMTVTLALEPASGELRPDETAESELDVVATAEGLHFERIRPVRWYEMRVGAYLPEGFLEAPPVAAPAAEAEPEVEEPAPPPAAAASTSERLGSRALWSLALAGLGLLLLAVKWRAGTAGFRGREGSPPPLLLPLVPAPLRWLFVAACLGAGAWLQGATSLAAGTLAFAAGVLLAVRGPARPVPAPPAPAWLPRGAESLEEVVAEASAADRRSFWPRLLDGTSVAGLPLLALAAAAAAAAVRALWVEGAEATLSDALLIDLSLVLVGVFATGRRRDLPPSRSEGAARVLGRARRALGRAAVAAGCELRLLVGRAGSSGGVEDLRMALVPPPPGTRRVEVAVARSEGVFGWVSRPVAVVRRADGAVVTLRARGGRGLARLLRKQLALEATRAS